MRAEILDEPALEFGGGARHIDPRFGLTAYGPADLGNPTAPAAIRVGLIGPADQADGTRRWFERCRSPIAAKDERYPHLFPAFPGCDTDTGLYTQLTFADRNVRQITARQLRALDGRTGADTVGEAVDIYASEIVTMAEEHRVDVIVVARPDELNDTRAKTRRWSGRRRPKTAPASGGLENFHDLLKARTLHLGIPLQIIRRSTWDEATPPPRAAGARTRRRGPGTCTSRCTTKLVVCHGGCSASRPPTPPATSVSPSTVLATALALTPRSRTCSTNAATV
ncbi:argonaute/piwi family protein [Micromonospora parva]|uniref:hypothetical protein n=1 Tax=Micromonospora parva TaxID=1464048 RepID=UPI00366127AE